MENRFTVRDIVIIGMLSSLCIVGTSIKVPYGNGAMVHLGTAALFTSAILFGGVKGGMAGAIGSGLFDLMMGMSAYTLWSFFIKGIAGFIVGSIAHGGRKDGKSVIRNIIATILGALWTLVGYIAAWTFVIGKFEVALANIPSSLMTSSVGIIVAIPLSIALKKAMVKYEIQ